MDATVVKHVSLIRLFGSQVLKSNHVSTLADNLKRTRTSLLKTSRLSLFGLSLHIFSATILLALGILNNLLAHSRDKVLSRTLRLFSRLKRLTNRHDVNIRHQRKARLAFIHLPLNLGILSTTQKAHGISQVKRITKEHPRTLTERRCNLI